jgi:hypothetical protein
MKKLFLIRYTYQYTEDTVKHHEDNYYLVSSLGEAIKDIESKFNDGVNVHIIQFEEIYYKEI